MRQPSFWRSVAHALAGLKYTFSDATKRPLARDRGLTAIALASWLNIDAVRWAILLLTIGAVCAGETINTTVEALVDCCLRNGTNEPRSPKMFPQVPSCCWP